MSDRGGPHCLLIISFGKVSTSPPHFLSQERKSQSFRLSRTSLPRRRRRKSLPLRGPRAHWSRASRVVTSAPLTLTPACWIYRQSQGKVAILYQQVKSQELSHSNVFHSSWCENKSHCCGWNVRNFPFLHLQRQQAPVSKPSEAVSAHRSAEWQALTVCCLKSVQTGLISTQFFFFFLFAYTSDENTTPVMPWAATIVCLWEQTQTPPPFPSPTWIEAGRTSLQINKKFSQFKCCTCVSLMSGADVHNVAFVCIIFLQTAVWEPLSFSVICEMKFKEYF